MLSRSSAYYDSFRDSRNCGFSSSLPLHCVHKESSSNRHRTMNTDVGEGPSQLLQSPPRTIDVGDTVLIKIPSGDVRTIKLEKEGYVCSTMYFVWIKANNTFPRTIYLGKFGSFYSKELVGQQFGLSYEIRDKKLKVLPPRTFQEVGRTIIFRGNLSDLAHEQRILAQQMN